jgi:hypothetical protein
MPFEVQTYTITDGWINCWSIENEHGNTTPMFFKTYTEALEELSDFLANQHEAYTNGAMEDVYDPHDYRIMEIV